jgi:hypothetical protein
MIEIRPIMNSCAEDVLSFKSCCGLRMFEQNLEIHLENKGYEKVVMHGYFDLVGDFGQQRITTVAPPGDKVIEPEETIACYCYMDDQLWNRTQHIRFYDRDGTAYETDVD